MMLDQWVQLGHLDECQSLCGQASASIEEAHGLLRCISFGQWRGMAADSAHAALGRHHAELDALNVTVQTVLTAIGTERLDAQLCQAVMG